MNPAGGCPSCFAVLKAYTAALDRVSTNIASPPTAEPTGVGALHQAHPNAIHPAPIRCRGEKMFGKGLCGRFRQTPRYLQRSASGGWSWVASTLVHIPTLVHSPTLVKSMSLMPNLTF